MRRPILSALLLLFAVSAAANPIQDENARPGSQGWMLVRGRSSDIEGYASLTSVNAGDPISFYVSTAAPNYTLQIFRMGWYGGSGGRQMADAVQLAGVQQPACPPDPATGLIECRWTNAYSLTIPAGWVSGVYLAKIATPAEAAANWIIFVVRNDGRPSDLLFQSSVTTFEAYNAWGGKSLYPFNSTGPQAVKVSFDRPYGTGVGPQEFLRWEYPTIRFLEREGYDVTYSTDVDTHRRGDQLLLHKGFLSIGHDEYWSWQMRQAVEKARDAGVNLAFFSSNTCYWQIRFEPDSAGNFDRTIVGYKESALSADPILADGDPTNDYLATTAWRKAPVNRPEEMFKGSMFTFTTTPVSGDIVIEDATHWVFAGTGLKAGDRLPGLLGYEVDRMFDSYPPGTKRLAHSPFPNNGATDYADMTIYRAASGAWVFSTGSMQWAYGLDDPGMGNRGDAPPGGWVSAGAQQITRNVLNAFAQSPAHLLRRRAVRR